MKNEGQNNRILERSSEAKQDIIEIADYIAQDNYESAVRFLLSAEESFHLLSDLPRIGKTIRIGNRMDQEFRLWPIHGFEKILILYEVTEKTIRIVRVIHASRDLGSIFDNLE